jgi:hypothetical protein
MLSKILSVLGGDLIGEVGDLIRQWQDGKISKDELAFKIKTFEAANEQAIRLAQLEINKEEAKHSSLFVSGGRPFIVWVCGIGFAMNFLIGPLLTFLCALAGVPVVFPTIDISGMMPLLLGLLGLGGMRTYEKMKGVARNSLND